MWSMWSAGYLPLNRTGTRGSCWLPGDPSHDMCVCVSVCVCVCVTSGAYCSSRETWQYRMQ